MRIDALPAELLEVVLGSAGPGGVVALEATSRVSLERCRAGAPWFRFVEHFYGARGGPRADWRLAFEVCRKTETMGSWVEGPDLAPRARVVHAGGGREFWNMGLTPSRVLDANSVGWSTSRGSFRNVDLVVDLGRVALVAGVRLENQEEYEGDNPVKEALVFASVAAPNLGALADRFDDGGRDASSRASVAAATGAFLGGPKSGLPRSHLVVDGASPFGPSGAVSTLGGRPVCARFVTFKLLSSFNPNGHADPNVDVSRLVTRGLHHPPGLPDLAAALDVPIDPDDPPPLDEHGPLPGGLYADALAEARRFVEAFPAPDQALAELIDRGEDDDGDHRILPGLLRRLDEPEDDALYQ